MPASEDSRAPGSILIDFTERTKRIERKPSQILTLEPVRVQLTASTTVLSSTGGGSLTVRLWR